MLDLLDEFRAPVAALDDEDVEYAVAVHARPRATLDVDLLVPAEQLERARAVARRLGYRLDAGRLGIRPDVVELVRLSKPDPETGDLLPLALIVVTPPLEAAWSTRERVAWRHGTLPVVSREGLSR